MAKRPIKSIAIKNPDETLAGHDSAEDGRKQLNNQQLTPYKRQELFIAWTHEQTLGYVSRECGVSRPTVARYRDLDKWDERIALMHAGLSDEVDKMLAASTIMQLHEVSVLRQRAYLEAMKGEFKDARQAMQSYIDLTKLEREIAPKAGEGGGEDLLAIARNAYLMNKARQTIEAPRRVRGELLPPRAVVGDDPNAALYEPIKVDDNLPDLDDYDDSKGDT